MKWPFARRAQGTADIRTARLRLVAITPSMLVADAAGDGSLAELVGARQTSEWPPKDREPHVLVLIQKQFEEGPATLGWHRYVVLPGEKGSSDIMVGTVGGFPMPDGDVEISYSLLPEFHRQNYGTESVIALVGYLLARGGVRSVSAQASIANPGSIKIMERCGMQHVGSGDDVGTVRYRRMRSIYGPRGEFSSP